MQGLINSFCEYCGGTFWNESRKMIITKVCQTAVQSSGPLAWELVYLLGDFGFTHSQLHGRHGCVEKKREGGGGEGGSHA